MTGKTDKPLSNYPKCKGCGIGRLMPYGGDLVFCTNSGKKFPAKSRGVKYCFPAWYESFTGMGKR